MAGAPLEERGTCYLNQANNNIIESGITPKLERENDPVSHHKGF